MGIGFIKKAVEGHQKTQVVAYVALGVAVVALIAAFAIAGGRNNANR